MTFDAEKYEVEEVTAGNQIVQFRAFRNILYVEHPVDEEYQRLNLFVPECYYTGQECSGYTLKTAPVFMPNQVGGYMPGELGEPGLDPRRPGQPNAIFQALCHGYVVVVPSIRGRTRPGGKAPACIVDYKAAVRWLHYFSDILPGDMSKIITSGTSAGGALSALMGAAGDHPDYLPYLKAIGAADASDAVFAANCYCPITDLEHADMAYEWQFRGVNEYHRKHMKRDEGGRPVFSADDGCMNEAQIQASADEAVRFPAYINSLDLRDQKGEPLAMAEDGSGTFKEYIEQILLASAQGAMDRGMDVSESRWLTVTGGKAAGVDFAAYARSITRMKTAPAFDALTMDSPENDLFGTDEIPCRHFTAYSSTHSLANGAIAEPSVVRLLNPMAYIGDAQAATAAHWRIRHGTHDRDTSLAVSAILTCKLREAGCRVDHAAPWGVPHSGDYDLDELFAWIDDICRCDEMV